jgi:tetratricopeptide (TPR) repeat protein
MAKNTKRRTPSPQRAADRQAPKNALPWIFFLKLFGLVVAVLWTFQSALPGDWDVDDLLYLVNNPLQHDPDHLWKIWFAPGSFVEYYPITETVQLVQWNLWHDATPGYVCTNIILHLVNALLVWRLLYLLKLRLAWVGGLLFAIHPLTVESVAWISEIKNTLSLAPFLLAMGSWIQYEETKSNRDYALALGLFTVAMLCKIIMAPFAAIILIFAWWKRGRIGLDDLKACLPFLLIALVLGITNFLSARWFAEHYPVQGAKSGIPMDGILARIAASGLSGAFYFAKFFWPWTPAPLYPQWSVNPYELWQFLPWPLLALVLYLCWRKRQTGGRHVLLGVAYFFLMLAPFLGFIPISFMNFTWVMDHFTYLPMIGLIALVVAGMEQAYHQLAPAFRPWSAAALALLLFGLALETHSYARTYSSQESLYTYDVRLNPGSFMAHECLGDALLKKNDLAGAIQEYNEALALSPHSDAVHFSLGTALMQAQRWEEARAHFEEAIRLTPDFVDAYDNLAATLLQLGHPDEAITQLRRALQITDLAQVHNDLGNALLQMQRADEAIAEYRKAVQLNPDAAQVHDNLALALCAQKRFPEAIEQFQLARTLDPHDETARQALDKLSGASSSSPQ